MIGIFLAPLSMIAEFIVEVNSAQLLANLASLLKLGRNKFKSLVEGFFN